MDTSKPMTASEREALIADLGLQYCPACDPEPSSYKHGRACRAAAELSRLTARVAELEGAAITDAAVERAVGYCALYMTTHKTKRGADDEVITTYLRDMLRGAFEAAFRSESHQASAEAST